MFDFKYYDPDEKKDCTIYSPYYIQRKKDFYNVKTSDDFEHITKRLTWNRFDFHYNQYY